MPAAAAAVVGVGSHLDSVRGGGRSTARSASPAAFDIAEGCGAAARGDRVRRRGGRPLQHADVREQGAPGVLDRPASSRGPTIKASHSPRRCAPRASTRTGLHTARRGSGGFAGFIEMHIDQSRSSLRRCAGRHRQVAGQPDATRADVLRPGRSRGHDAAATHRQDALGGRAAIVAAEDLGAELARADRHSLADPRRAERDDHGGRARPAVDRRALGRSGASSVAGCGRCATRRRPLARPHGVPIASASPAVRRPGVLGCDLRAACTVPASGSSARGPGLGVLRRPRCRRGGERDPGGDGARAQPDGASATRRPRPSSWPTRRSG